MKRNYLFLSVALTATSFMTSCDNNNDDPKPDTPVESLVGEAVYILNQGNHDRNVEGSLNVLSLKDDEMLESVFRNVNKRSLGKTPQCGVSYGSKIYIGMSDSNTIEIIDRATFKSIKQISLENSDKGQYPRDMVVDNGNVYISMFDGYVARLDTISCSIDAAVKVGPNPEIMGILGDKLYVPNSDGMNYPDYGETATIIDLSTFTKEKDIQVPLNPYEFLSNGKELFLIAKGNYIDIPSAIYRVDKNFGFEKIADASMGSVLDDKLYFINAPWGEVPSGSIYIISTGEMTPMDISVVDAPSAIGVNPDDGQIFISSYPLDGGMSNYLLPGYVCLFTPQGKYTGKKFKIGAGPAAIFFNN